MLDGVSNMDNYQANNSPTPNPDATQEFRLISNNYSAIYGFSSGGVVSLATRSGTNQVHGGLFEFWRNQVLNARNWNSGLLDPLKRHQFGGYVGGPIRKDKLFGFFNYQGTREIGAGSANSTTTPTQQELTGDFSGLVTYAQATAKNGSCGSGLTGPHTTTCGWLRGPFVIANGLPNQLVGGASALDPVAVQVTNGGLPGHTAPASGTGPPTNGQNLAGQMYYQTAAIKDSNLGASFAPQPPTFNIDASLSRNFIVHERYNLQLRFEMFNALNHPVMGAPDTNPSDSTFGQINQGRGFAVNASRLVRRRRSSPSKPAQGCS